MHKHKITEPSGNIFYVSCFGNHELYKKPVSAFIKVVCGIAVWSMILNVLFIINR